MYIFYIKYVKDLKNKKHYIKDPNLLLYIFSWEIEKAAIVIYKNMRIIGIWKEQILEFWFDEIEENILENTGFIDLLK